MTAYSHNPTHTKRWPDSRMNTQSTSPQATKSDDYRLDLDGLRGIAVLVVIANHLNERLMPNGYLGVDIFFVISGYVISLSLSKYNSGNLGEFLGVFYSAPFLGPH